MTLEAFFGAGAGDDALTVAPAELGTELPLLLPKLLEPLLETMHLGLHLRVVALGQLVPELDAPFAELVDLAGGCSPMFSFVSSTPSEPGYSRPPKPSPRIAKAPLVD